MNAKERNEKLKNFIRNRVYANSGGMKFVHLVTDVMVEACKDDNGALLGGFIPSPEDILRCIEEMKDYEILTYSWAETEKLFIHHKFSVFADKTKNAQT